MEGGGEVGAELGMLRHCGNPVGSSPALVSPQHHGFSIPGDVMEIPVDKGLDEAHVMNVEC